MPVKICDTPSQNDTSWKIKCCFVACLNITHSEGQIVPDVMLFPELQQCLCQKHEKCDLDKNCFNVQVLFSL